MKMFVSPHDSYSPESLTSLFCRHNSIYRCSSCESVLSRPMVHYLNCRVHITPPLGKRVKCFFWNFLYFYTFLFAFSPQPLELPAKRPYPVTVIRRDSYRDFVLVLRSPKVTGARNRNRNAR